jgi:hypothetical protein
MKGMHNDVFCKLYSIIEITERKTDTPTGELGRKRHIGNTYVMEDEDADLGSLLTCDSGYWTFGCNHNILKQMILISL